MKCMKLHTFLKSLKIRVTVMTVALFLLSSCVSEYREHFQFEHSTVSIISWEYRASEYTDNISILPNKNIKQDIIRSIEESDTRIWIEIYMWTDKDIMNALIDAHKRWVDVRVLMERNVYSLPRVNVPVYTELEKSGIPVKYTDSYRFTFTHAKFWIIDNTYSISSGNLTKSFFNSNRDFILSGTDTVTLDFLTSLFLGDFSYIGIDKELIPASMVLSPIDARSKIEYLLASAQKNIILYTQTLTDHNIINLLKEKQKEWINVQICTADNESNRESFSGSVLPWTLLKKPYLHGKVILIDSDKFFLWSQNLTRNSLENNREVGIILRDSGVLYNQLEDSFRKDCIFD